MVNQRILKSWFVGNTFLSITAKFFKISQCTNHVFFLIRMHFLLAYLDGHSMCHYSIILGQFSGSSHMVTPFFMAMDGLYVVRGQEVRSDDVRMCSQARKMLLHFRHFRLSWRSFLLLAPIVGALGES
jgi:hypothetical protein